MHPGIVEEETYPHDLAPDQVEWFATQVPAFELGPAHAGTHARSMMRLRSNSAMAPMITSRARPSLRPALPENPD